jgi:V/A-type H+/Na+-transporting ATPase subunit E
VKETSINGIIEKIKKEGAEKAEQKAAAILSSAEEEKKSILGKARAEASEILAKSEKDADRARQNAETAIKQAARDVILGLKGSITDLFDGIVKKRTGEALDPGTMKKMMESIAEKFTEGNMGEIEAIVSEQDKEALEGLFTAELGKEMASGVTLFSSREVSKGFRIGEKGAQVYYDFTDEAISEALSAYLNKGLRGILSSGKNDE